VTHAAKEADFAPSGVITLTTDIGHKGPFVAMMKGVMLCRFPTAKIVDVTHETSPHFPAEAGFWLERSYRYFPLGSVHLGVVDPGVGTGREILVVVSDGHVFVAPDNGLIGTIAERENARVHRLDLDEVPGVDRDAVSATFHGRDVFAPLGAELAAGRVKPNSLGPTVDSVVPSWIEPPTVTKKRVAGVVVTRDSFGNLITNIDAELIEAFKSPVVVAGGLVFPLRRTYSSVSPGDYLALVNSFGVVELARAEKSAAEGLGLSRGAPVRIEEGPVGA